MKSRSLIYLRHILLWFAMIVAYFFSVEPFLNISLPGIHEVEIWLKLEIYGIAVITLLSVIVLLIALRKKRSRDKNH
jgi:intracellular septation protein A